jgi:hypothetical protein
VIKVLRQALEITVPSNWVAETLRRDMRVNPHILPHGIEWDEWQETSEKLPIILWNKNRASDVCDPTPVVILANKYAKLKFVTTFTPRDYKPIDNIRVTGLLPHEEMRQLIKSSRIYLATTKETFGIGVLEAMASGVPILGFAYGGNLDLVKHGVNGYLAKPDDYDDLANGLEYCVAYGDTLGANGREMAKDWTWEKTCEKLRRIYDLAKSKKSLIPTMLKEEDYTI